MERDFEKLKRNYHIQVEGNKELLGISYGEVAIAQGGTNNPRGAVCAEQGFQDYVPVERYFGLPIEEKYGGKIYAIVDDKVYISRGDEDIILSIDRPRLVLGTTGEGAYDTVWHYGIALVFKKH